jgi:hypothetical protein
MNRISFLEDVPQWVFWGLAFLGLVLAAEKIATYGEPIERDIATYAVIGHEIGQGKTLYSDLWEVKPPGVHLTYALFEKCFGENDRAILVMNFIFCGLTLVGVFLAASVHASGWRAGLCGALFWAILSGDLNLQADQPNTELFINAIWAWAFALWLRPGWKFSGVGTGIMFGLAAVFKPLGLIPLAVWCLLFCVPGLREEKGWWNRVLKAWFGVTVVGICFLAWMKWMGILGDYWAQGVAYERFLLLQQAPQAVSTSWLEKLPVGFGGIACLAILGLVGWWRSRRSNTREYLLGFGFLGASAVGVVANRFYFPHYFQLCLVPLIVLGAWGAMDLAEKLQGWRRWAMPVLVSVLLMAHEAPFYRLSPEEWAARKYPHDALAEVKHLGLWLGRVVDPKETIYLWGFYPQVYFYSQREPATAFVYSIPLIWGPDRGDLSHKELSRLQAHPPDWVVVLDPHIDVKGGLTQIHPVYQWILANYHFVKMPLPYTFKVGILSGSPAEKRDLVAY